MKTITFYLDFISPYAYLAFERLPETLQGISHEVRYKPILFAGLLKHHGQLGPAEIPVKREWIYRQVLWLANQSALPMDLPASHPFNPLALLRLALQCAHPELPNRHVVETIFRHVWRGGQDAIDPARLQALSATLPAPRSDLQTAKERLSRLTEEAIADGVFGVPTFKVDDKCFWGVDALPMLRAYLQGEPWFAADGKWDQAPRTGVGVQRNTAR